MLDKNLQIILFFSTLLFLIYIINMVRNKKLELRYILIWLLAGVGLLLTSIMPGIINVISNFLHIVEPVNTLYLIIIFFLILIIFSLTKEMSKYYMKISVLVQELGIVKLEIEKMKKYQQEMQEKDK